MGCGTATHQKPSRQTLRCRGHLLVNIVEEVKIGVHLAVSVTRILRIEGKIIPVCSGITDSVVHWAFLWPHKIQSIDDQRTNHGGRSKALKVGLNLSQVGDCHVSET